MKPASAILSLVALFSYLNTAAAPVTREVADSAVNSLPAATAADSIADTDFTQLDDFVIVQRKKLVESDGAKLSYNVSEDPDANASNILDILRKVPGVSVDADETIRVNGKTSFKILMDGHENPMLKGDVKTVLKSLPAASVKKIEVISEPGAKYEAEGAGGILNIVTDRKKDLSGFMTRLQAWASASNVGGSVNARTKVGKVMIDANLNYNNGKLWPRSSHSERETENLNDPVNHLQTSKSKTRRSWDYAGANLSMSWEPDTLNLFTLSANYGNNGNTGRSDEHRRMLRDDMSELWSLSRHTDNNQLHSGTGAQVSYQHVFGREGHNLVVSYEYDYYFDKLKTGYTVTESTRPGIETPYQASKEIDRSNSHILQIDYANPFSPKHLLETGAKMHLDNTAGLSRAFFGNDASDAAPDNDRTVDLSQFKNVYALYASYTGTFSSWNAKAGLRYEHTDMGLRYRTAGYSDFTSRLNDVVPNAALSYNFSPAASLRLAYQMRISRPNIWYLNPYVDTMTPGQIQYGNPDLKSTKSHAVSLAYSNYEGKFTGSAKIGYSYDANSITDILFARDGIINSTYANVGHNHYASIDLNGEWNFSDRLSWSVYADCVYQYLKADSELLKAKHVGWRWSASSYINYTLPCKVRMSLYGGYWSPWIDLQSRGVSGYYYGIGARRSFLRDDALEASVSINTPFPVSRRNGYTQCDDSVRLTSRGWYKQWNVSVGISWRFGGLKAGVKQTAAQIERDDSSRQSGSGK